MLIIALAAGLAMAALLVWFVDLELRDKRHVIFLTFIIVFLVEALLAGRAAEVPRGILRPAIGGQDFRPPDAVIVAALAARALSVKGNRVTGMAILWAGFLVLYIASAPIGILNDFVVVKTLFQAKGAFYITGGIVIASGADPRRLAEGVSRLAPYGAGAVIVAFIFSLLNFRLAFSIPGQQFRSLGNLGADSITLVTMLGIVTLLCEATRDEVRPITAISGMIMMMSPVAGTQRASYLVMAVSLLLILSLFASTTWRRRSAVTLLEVSLVALAIIALAGVNVVIGNAGEVVAPIEDAFTGAAEQRSAESRFGLADQALSKIAERPVLGWGTGVQVIRKAELSNREFNAAAHNIILDVTMRVGLVGLVAFLAAVVSSLWTSARLWRQANSDQVAAVAIAAGICMAAMLTKGMVEPAIDKFRLSTSLGLSAGMIMACVHAHQRTSNNHSSAGDAAPFPRASMLR